jgi:hypothetical protein
MWVVLTKVHLFLALSKSYQRELLREAVTTISWEISKERKRGAYFCLTSGSGRGDCTTLFPAPKV